MSAIFFLNEAGKPLISRNFKGSVPMSCVDDFPRLLQENDTPCFHHNGVHYVYVRHADLILLLVSGSANLNVVAMLHFLYRVIDSFGVFVTHVEVESVIDNFVVLYELLDEMMDFGSIQTTDANMLQDYVTQSSYKLEVSQAVSTLTDAVSWRPPGIWYKKNELFVDVVETVSAQVVPTITNKEDESGKTEKAKVLHSEITGVVRLRSFLSGMPHLTLGLNNIASMQGLSYHRASRFVVLSDVAFHQCVDLDRYDSEQVIEFIPPDGQFDLLTYRVQPKPLGGDIAMFDVQPRIDIRQSSRVLISCSVTAQYKRRQHCKQLEITLPVPPDCDSPRCTASSGNVVYVPEHQQVQWRITNFGGGQTATMQAELQLAGGAEARESAEDAARVYSTPVTLRFEMPGSARSGLHIRFLKIDEKILQYQALPWVRYLTKSGDYEVRHARVVV